MSETNGTLTTGHQYDELDRLKRTDRPDTTNTVYQYDTRGNIKQTSGLYIDPGEYILGNYNFNIWGELSSFTTVGQNYSYAYDSKGLRVGKTGPATNIRYYNDNDGRIITESSNSDQLAAQTIWGHKPLARKIGANYYYYIYNGHGDVVQIIDSAGNIVNSYEYDEWGNVTSQTEGIANDFEYAGEAYDSETGFYYLRARYYDPTVGRFISEDSNEGQITNPLSLNLYTYCVNNPIKYVDPSGNIYIFADPIRYNEQQAEALWDIFRPDETDVTYFQAGGPCGPELGAAAYTVRRIVKLGKFTVKAVEKLGTKGADKASKYEDITSAGSRYINKSTDVTKAEFGENLVKNGWTKSLSKDGKTIIYQKDGAKYVLRDGAKSTGGPTADYYKAGSKSIDIKIRLGEK